MKMLARLDNVFDDLFYPFSQNSWVHQRESKLSKSANLFPRIKTLEDKLQLSYDVPGVTLDNLEILSEDRLLTVKATRKDFDETVTYHYSLSSKYDGSLATASLQNGVLVLDVPQREESKSRKIKIIAKE